DIDQEQGAEEAGQPAIGLVAVAIPRCLEQRDEEREPDRHGDEEEVVDACHRELPPGQVEVHGWSLPLMKSVMSVMSVTACRDAAAWSPIRSSHQSAAYRPPVARSSPCVPCSTIPPASSTTISSTRSSPESRWV